MPDRIISLKAIFHMERSFHTLDARARHEERRDRQLLVCGMRAPHVILMRGFA